jgi:ferredoxin
MLAAAHQDTAVQPPVSSRLRVNPIACDAHGLCAELFPAWISLDDWGYPIGDARPLPPELKAHARRTVDACPASKRRSRPRKSRAVCDLPKQGSGVVTDVVSDD